MGLAHILVFTLLAVLIGGLLKGRWRQRALLLVSVGALYALQPTTPIRYLDFWLPTASLALTGLVWALTRPAAPPPSPAENRAAGLTAGGIGLLVVALALTRYLNRAWVSWLIPARPPELGWVLLLGAGVSLLVLALLRWRPAPHRLLPLAVGLLILTFVILKTEPLARLASQGARVLTGQAAAQASALDWRWLGFSYLAFRLIHSLRDRMSGRLPALSLGEFVTYALFFPAFTAGPIDRAERFVKELRTPATDFAAATDRLVIGLFKKFALADTLAIFALNEINAAQVRPGLWAWVLVYAYAFRIYFDFSGYTDIAIGLGRLLGFKLPENFDRPYQKPNLTIFWNSWHITLSQWFRAYWFNPLTRALRSRPLPPAVIIFIGQTTTMLLIGLWHGLTWNFVLWGLWHAGGLFAHSRWSEFLKPRQPQLDQHPRFKRFYTWAGILATFHYVTLGWVWFALPSLPLSLSVFQRLLGR